MEYEVIIGIEIHCELKTKTKMFSGAPVLFGAPANTCVNEIDLGHPGTMPCLNKQAVAMAVQACTALNMEIDPLVRFDRKKLLLYRPAERLPDHPAVLPDRPSRPCRD